MRIGMGLYDRDYTREPQDDHDTYIRRLVAAGVVRPRQPNHGALAVERTVVVPAEGTFWPEFEGLPVKRTIVLPEPRMRVARQRPRRRPSLGPELRLLLRLALVALIWLVVSRLTGWHVLVW